jgi:prepilin-type N-terminal cleavage/methylation domain-containing protein
MTRSFRTSSRRRLEHGVTLIEVLAGLVILGTLVAALALARGRAMRQYADAELRLQAARAADAMLSIWLDGPADAVPIRGGGALSGVPGCTWRTVPVLDPSADQLGVVVVRFEAWSSQTGQLMSIDFVVPKRPEHSTQ